MKTGFKETTLKTYEYLQGFSDLAFTRFLISTQYENYENAGTYGNIWENMKNAEGG